MSVNRKDQAPIWTRPAPGTRRPRFTREQIAETALHVADAEGFAAVSMRRVAEVLGAATMTLYHYVRTKDDLLALMDDTLMGSVLVDEEVFAHGWRAALTAIAHRTHEVFLRHPWALYELRGARSGPNSLHHVEQSLRAVDTAPLDKRGKIELLGIMDDFVFGHALRATQIVAPPEPHVSSMQAIRSFMEEQLASGQFPFLAKMIDLDAPPEKQAWALMSSDATFERGLRAILDSVERAPPPKLRRSRAR